MTRDARVRARGFVTFGEGENAKCSMVWEVGWGGWSTVGLGFQRGGVGCGLDVGWMWAGWYESEKSNPSLDPLQSRFHPLTSSHRGLS